MPKSQYGALQHAVAVGSAKEAALYSEVVVPFDLAAGRTGREIETSISMQDGWEGIVTDLMKGIPDSVSLYRAHIGICDVFWSTVFLESLIRDGLSIDEAIFRWREECAVPYDLARLLPMSVGVSLDDMIGAVDLDPTYLENLRIQCRDMLSIGIQKLGISSFSTWYDPYYRWHATTGTPEDSATPAVSLYLHGLPLINADKLSWQQVLDIRGDEKASSALRDFRLALHEQMLGKDPEYVRDRLGQAAERYSSSVRDWRLETWETTLEFVVSHKGIMATSLGALACLALGMPLGTASLLATIGDAVSAGAVVNFVSGLSLGFLRSSRSRHHLDFSPEGEFRYLHILQQKTA